MEDSVSPELSCITWLSFRFIYFTSTCCKCCFWRGFGCTEEGRHPFFLFRNLREKVISVTRKNTHASTFGSRCRRSLLCSPCFGGKLRASADKPRNPPPSLHHLWLSNEEKPVGFANGQSSEGKGTPATFAVEQMCRVKVSKHQLIRIRPCLHTCSHKLD